MYNYTCAACSYAFTRPDKSSDDVPCPKCGKLMDVKLAENKNRTLALVMMPLGLLAAFGTWYGIKAFNEKQPYPPVIVTQPQQAK